MAPSLFPLLEYHLSKSAYIRSIFVVTMLANKLRQKMRHFTQMPPPNLLLTKKIELSTYCTFKPSSFWTILSSTNIIWPYICVSEYPSLTLDLQGRLNSVPSSNQSRKINDNFWLNWRQNPPLSKTLAFVWIHVEWWQRLILRHFQGTIPTTAISTIVGHDSYPGGLWCR